MRLVKKTSGQSILEYALLLGVIIAAILIMQVWVKRGFQAHLKDASDKIGGGQTFSAGSTGISENRTLSTNQTIKEEVATTKEADTGIASYVGVSNISGDGTVEAGVYSYTNRSGGKTTSEVKEQTDAATQEKFRWDEYQTNVWDDFTEPY